MHEAITYPPLIEQKNRLALALPEAVYVPAPQAVEVPQGGAAKAFPLLVTRPDRTTWVEPVPVANVSRAWNDLVAALQRKDDAVIREKQPAPSGARAVAAVASDADDTARLVVFGFGNSFSDQAADEDNTATADLFVAAVNWLRDRPPAASVAGKTYGEYRPTKTLASAYASAFWLPVGGLFVVVVFLGLGVWSYRRK
jgi:hypothetical protein